MAKGPLRTGSTSKPKNRRDQRKSRVPSFLQFVKTVAQHVLPSRSSRRTAGLDWAFFRERKSRLRSPNDRVALEEEFVSVPARTSLR